MDQGNGYRVESFNTNRHLVAASSAAARRFNTIHSLLEINVTQPWQIIKDYQDRTGQKISFTAYLVTCLAAVIQEFPGFNSFRRGSKVIHLDDLTISVLVERGLAGGAVPEPVGIQKVQKKSILEVQSEIRAAQESSGNQMGDLSGQTWIRFLPPWFLGIFIKIASGNIKMAQRYGKVAVTAVGMFSAPRNWLIPLSSATVLATIGGIHTETMLQSGNEVENQFLHLTLSFNHDLIDGAPAARFGRRMDQLISSAELLQEFQG
jgi:pyruvate/2-oxoglutarate dehydrogenase complex dihydrolipoamide acyltransferase (E2) component